jgi:hypothetical protein
MIGKHFLQRNLQIIDSIGIALLLKIISFLQFSAITQHLGQFSSYENKDQQCSSLDF